MDYGYQSAYRNKLSSAAQVIAELPSSSHVFMGEFLLFPQALDKALTDRALPGGFKELVVEGTCMTTVPSCIRETGKTSAIRYMDWHFGSNTRKAARTANVEYLPLTYHQGPRLVSQYKSYDAVFLCTGPMGPRGNFNFGICNSLSSGVLKKAKKIVVEVNPELPRCLGGNQESIHISRVDSVVETAGSPLPEILPATPTETDRQIARHVMDVIPDGACIQLGIGGLPNQVGTLIAESDLKDLGVHTEMLVDACVDLYLSGRITGARKTIDRYKMAYTFALGTSKLYEFLDENPVCASYPVSYVNDPRIIALNPGMIAVNNAVEVDLLSQVASETVGYRHISGTGGQFDFIFGAFNSKGGKGIIALSSAYTDAKGNLKSRIVPGLSPGTVVTVPRSIVQYVATEFGLVQLKGKSVRERAEALISIAHPKFQDELLMQADTLGLLKANRKTDALAS